MQGGIILKNGYVIDPMQCLYKKENIFIKGKRIVTEAEMKDVAITEINVKDMLVMPGLIDFHAHVYPNVTEIGLEPDLDFLPQGVTTVIDAGSAGVSNVKAFVEDVILRNKMNVYGLLNVCPTGMGTMKFHENVNPAYWDELQIEEVITKWPNLLKALKIRFSKEIVGDMGIELLQKALSLAGKINVPLATHVTNGPVPQSEIVSLLRKGDFYVHCFQGKGHTILDENGEIFSAIWDAQQRGVIMDAANGGNHWSFRVAEAALHEGFIPDVISTDLTVKTVYKNPVFSLPFLMAKYIMLGLPIETIVKCCTENPAKALGIDQEVGGLKPGMYADVAVMKEVPKEIVFKDTESTVKRGKLALIPQMTILRGKIVYRNIDSLSI